MESVTLRRADRRDRLVDLVHELTGCAQDGARVAVDSARPDADPLSVVAEAMVTLRNGRITEIDLRPRRYVATVEPRYRPDHSRPAFIGAGPDWP